MARTVKKKEELTIEEKLAEALVPMEEQPYLVPKNWCWVHLGSVSTNQYGYTTKAVIDNTLPKLLRITDIQENGVDWKSVPNCHISSENLKKYLLKNNDIVIARIGATTGKSFLLSNPNNSVFASYLIRLRFYDGMLPAYVYYFLQSSIYWKQITELSSGIALPGVNSSKLQTMVFPLPPLPEQQRIVDRIESLFAKLDEAKEKAQAVVDGFEDRKAAILHKAFTGELTKEWRRNNHFSSNDLYERIQSTLASSKKKIHKKVQNDFLDALQRRIPKEWLLVYLDSISMLITDGEHKTPSRVDSYCGYYLLSARNIHNDALKLDDVDYIDEAEYKIISKRCNPRYGDILISCSGSVGRSCVINDDNKYCMVRSAAMISQPECNSRFIMYMIQSDAVQEQIQRLSKQTAQANLFLGAIASLLIPLPSKEEQDMLVERLDNLIYKLLQAKEAAEQVISQIDTMKKSILARAFRGELGTNDPADESAVELLKRIL